MPANNVPGDLFRKTTTLLGERRSRLLLTRIFITVALLLLVTSVPATRRERLIDSWKPLDYKVTLELNDRLTEITSARAEIKILSLKNNLTLIDLDFGELPIDSVTIDNHPAQFERSPDRLGR